MPRLSKPRTCRSKYVGQTVRVRGRDGTVVGCARPRVRPAPRRSVPRFRVTYAASGRTRPVPRATVYRAARCATRPSARGCRPFDPERAPWLARRTEDTSFDFGTPAPAPEALAPPAAPRGRVPEAPLPRWRPRPPELQGPARLPDHPLFAVLQPESRALAPWLAYAAPWAWESVAQSVARARAVDWRSGRALTRDERLATYGTNYGRGYGAVPEPNAPPRDLVSGLDHGPPFVPRGGVQAFLDDVRTVAAAILRLESGLWSGTLVRDSETGAPRLVEFEPPDKIYVPPGTHGSTAAAMRRRQAEKIDRAQRHLDATTRALAEADAVVRAWSSSAKAIPAGIEALPRNRDGHSTEHELAETWRDKSGRDWRLFVDRESAAVRLEQWDAAHGWRFRWGARFDLQRDEIPLDEAPAWVRAALAAPGAPSRWRLQHLFGGGLKGRRQTALSRYDDGRAPEDPFSADCAPSGAAGETWALTRRIPCAATREVRARLTEVRDRELRKLCNDPLSQSCDAFYALVEQGCAPACEPGKGRDDGACPRRITDAQIEAWSRGEEPTPAFVFDSDKPHALGVSDNCYFSASMQARLQFHDETLAQTVVPPQVERRGAAAVQKYLDDTVRAAELTHPLGPGWQKNDQRILGRVKAAHVFGRSILDDLKFALRAIRDGDEGPARSLVALYPGLPLLDADGAVTETSVAEALVQETREEIHRSSERGRAGRLARLQKLVRGRPVEVAAAQLVGVRPTATRGGSKKRTA